mmetsp:Transcript_42619/g.87119  ORF Transcript_42619/g.87119 Transcript_42619/m.87119 type:complete len:118 (-) Transcript_42619:118-471(-)
MHQGMHALVFCAFFVSVRVCRLAFPGIALRALNRTPSSFLWVGERSFVQPAGKSCQQCHFCCTVQLPNPSSSVGAKFWVSFCPLSDQSFVSPQCALVVTARLEACSPLLLSATLGVQ